MSQVIIEAVGLLRTVVEKIDTRLRELEFEQALLVRHRAQLVIIVDGEPEPAPAPVFVGRTFEARVVTEPRVTAPGRALPVPDEAATERVLQALAGQDAPRRYQFLENASKCSPTKAKRLIRALVDAGRIVRTGQTAACRYSLPSRSKRSVGAAPDGPRQPADDDGHGASVLDISAGEPAGMSDSPQDATHPSAAPVAPPASIVVGAPNVKLAESFGKVSDAQYVETDDVEDLDEPDDDPLDVADEPLDLDLQAELDDEPVRKRAGRPPKYKPGHRHLPATGETAPPIPSWWVRPDADFKAEAERMRLDPKQKKVPGEMNILCMGGAF